MVEEPIHTDENIRNLLILHNTSTLPSADFTERQAELTNKIPLNKQHKISQNENRVLATGLLVQSTFCGQRNAIYCAPR